MTSPIFAAAAAEWDRMRMAYGDYLEAHIAEAEAATNGYLVNDRGRTAGVTSGRLFMAGPAFVRAYASEELTDFWRTKPRMTLAQFEAQWAFQVAYDWDAQAA